MTELEHLLPTLPSYDPDPVREARVRSACHDGLRVQSGGARLEPALVIGACIMYLTGVVRTALTLSGR